MGSRPIGGGGKKLSGNSHTITQTTNNGSRKSSPENVVRTRGGTYTGACGCMFYIRDDARVLYFDDPILADVTAITGPSLCGMLRWILCGSRGQVSQPSHACAGKGHYIAIGGRGVGRD